MIRLLYISTARTILTATEIDNVLRISRRNNKAVDVTGLLIIGGRRFLQVLEGPEPAVMQTFDRIRADPRHFAVVILGKSTVETRLFGDWAMGYQPGGTLAGPAAIDGDVAALIAPIQDPIVQAYFQDFAQRHAA